MIPSNRPVLGMDLLELSQKLGLSVMDACWAFGLNMPSWSKRIKEDGALPLDDVALALMVRYLDMFPESCPVEKAMSPTDFYMKLEKYNDKQEPKERLSPALYESFDFIGSILGRDQSAGYRWVRKGGGTRPIIDRYINVLDKDLSQGVVTLREIRDLTIVEMAARELDTTDLEDPAPTEEEILLAAQ